MKIPTRLDCVVFDTTRISPDGSANFFVDRPVGDVELATCATEHGLIQWLLAQSRTRAKFCATLGLSHAALLGTRVTWPFIAGSNAGDIDILGADQHCPHAAVAAECKWAKIQPSESEGVQKVTKLSGVGKGIVQANELLKLGFHQTFLIICLVVDGRATTDVNFLHRGPTQAIYERVYDVREWQRLDEDVGVMFVEIVQPVHASINDAGMVGFAITKRAALRPQRDFRTAEVRRYLARSQVSADHSHGNS